MQKIKRVAIFLVFIILINFQIPVFADIEMEEEFDFTQIDEFLKAVNGEANEIPKINSRHAVVIDRATRTCIIWKKRK